jgi:acetylglutamate synthase
MNNTTSLNPKILEYIKIINLVSCNKLLFLKQNINLQFRLSAEIDSKLQRHSLIPCTIEYFD